MCVCVCVCVCVIAFDLFANLFVYIVVYDVLMKASEATPPTAVEPARELQQQVQENERSDKDKTATEVQAPAVPTKRKLYKRC